MGVICSLVRTSTDTQDRGTAISPRGIIDRKDFKEILDQDELLRIIRAQPD